MGEKSCDAISKEMGRSSRMMGWRSSESKSSLDTFFRKKKSVKPLWLYRTVIVCASRTDQEIDRSPVLFKGQGNVWNQRS